MPKAPKTNEIKYAEIYQRLGVDFSNKSSEERIAQCPFCMKEKLHVNDRSGVWNCFTCGESGNLIQFIRRLHEESFEGTKPRDIEQLCESRGNFSKGFEDWGIAKSFLTDEWIVPAYNAKGAMVQLYQWNHKLYPTKTLGHGLFGVNCFDDSRPIVDICEGPWDGMAWYDATQLFDDNSVIAVPGASIWKEQWNRLVEGKTVRILFDSDHPKTNKRSGKKMEPVGFRAAKSLARKLADVAKETLYLEWGPEGFNPDWPSGTDLRDLLTGKERV